jgi:hypothetical protein
MLEKERLDENRSIDEDQRMTDERRCLNLAYLRAHLIEYRRHLAETMNAPPMSKWWHFGAQLPPGKTNRNTWRLFVEMQTAIEAVDRALADEKALAHAHIRARA